MKGLLGGYESLIRISLGGLHLAEFHQGVGIVLVEGNRFVEGGLGSAEIFFAEEVRGAEEIVEATVGGRFCDLGVGGGDDFVGMILCEKGIQ